MKAAYPLALLFFILSFHVGNAINLPKVIKNTVYSDNIRTVEMYCEGDKLSNPIIKLNSEEQLICSFDDLNDVHEDYYYTIYHCNRDWELSSISQQEYMDSFFDFPLTDYEYSVNTEVEYINYTLKIPNEDVPIVLSGNYVLIIFDSEQPDQPLISWRFYVVDPKVNTSARIRRATYDPVNGENQEIDFIIDHENFAIQNPSSDIKVVITQNNRTDNAITTLRPLFINNKTLEYDYNMENTFKGENEFRAFEIRNIMHPGRNVEEIKFYPPVYHATLSRDYPRLLKPYNFFKEMNGNFYIEATNKDDPEIEADYLFVHFTLQITKPLLGGGIYVFGKLSNWQCTKPYEMQYSMERNQYELTLLLKQGYYNYTYAYKDNASNEIKCYNLEGSHYETENDYQIYVYYGRMTDRYDRLIGYNEFNSLSDHSY